MKRHLLLVLLLSAFCCAQRLPKLAIPEHYTLKLDPDMKSGDLTGEEELRLKVIEPTQSIVLNVVGLRIDKVLLTAAGRTQAGIATLEPAAEMVELTFPKKIPIGLATLSLKFSGKVRTDLKGLYFSKAEKRSYAVTQFEGTYARMMFPSFDEPAYKATFDISVVADNGDTAISNAAIAKDTPGPRERKHTIQFGTSPKMSTYLVALAIGDWKCSEGGVDGIPIRICSLPDKVALTTYALHAAEKFMHFYNGYYAIKYPFKKLDMVAIPDYEWGGMENTASVFYKERALLVDANTASIDSKRGVASVIAHEMAHQWFGDLVTMEWWNDVWLNEGFATWMTPKALSAWDPSWDQKPEVALRKTGVLEADARASTRPIRANGETPAEIKELFDGIAYEKGAAVLHMMEDVIGSEVFRKGVNSYLRRYQNGNATSEDFWIELQRFSGLPVSRIMNSFVNQAGVPVISFACTNAKCEFSQKRFKLPGQSVSDHTWEIPVGLRFPRSKDWTILLRSRNLSFPLPEQPLMTNTGASGYYRTDYTAAELSTVRSNWKTLLPEERLSIFDDEWAMVRADGASVTDFLDLISELRNEMQPTVFENVLPRLRAVRRLLDEQQVNKYDLWVRQQLPPSPSGEAQSDEQRSLHALIFAARTEANDPQALKEADQITAEFLKDPTAVDPTLATAALRASAQHGDSQLYDTLVAKSKSAPTPELYFRYLSLLASFQDPKLIDRTLALVMSPDVREQDVPFLLSGLLRNPVARDKAWQLLQDHWNELKGKIVGFGGSGPILTLGDYCSDDRAKEIKTFFDEHPLPGAERSMRGALEQISNCVAMKKSQGPALEKWIAVH